MGRNFRRLLIFGVGFLAGSKAGPKYYESFKKAMGRLRQTRLVSVPVEAAADGAAGFVRSRGFAMSERAAEAVHRSISGHGPVVVEARITDGDFDDTTVVQGTID